MDSAFQSYVKPTEVTSLAPIAIFVFRRPRHTAEVLASLSRNLLLSDSTLYVFCEGARSIDDIALVQETRQLIRSNAKAREVHIIEREQNLGCANSIITGINHVLREHDRVIVLEDDIVVSRHFLEYMNEGLDKYSHSAKVMHISAYAFPNQSARSSGAGFLPLISSWGWGTWRRAWSQFDEQLQALPWLKSSNWRRFRFDVYGAYRYYQMLQQCSDRTIDAWDIRWYLTVFRRGGLGLFPHSSLTANIGFDSTATHYTDSRFTVPAHMALDAKVSAWPSKVAIDCVSFYRASKFLSGGRPWRAKISELVRSMLKLRVQQ